MRILVAHNYYVDTGGEDAVFRSETELLRSFREEVFVYQRHNDELGKMGPLSKFGHLVSLGHNRSAYEELRSLLRQHRPQVAHFHNIYYMMTPAVYQACRDEGVAVVQSLHNFRMMCSNGLFFRDGHVCEDCLHKNIWEGVKHRCFRGSTAATAIMASTLDRQWQRGTWINDVDLYVAAAEFTRGKYIERGIPEGKIVIKPHFLYPEPEVQRQDRGYVLYLGRLREEKGVQVMLDAWRSLKDIPLKIAGSGPLSDDLKAYVRNNNLSNVEFLGLVAPQQCEQLIREAHVVVLPSVCYENFPRVVVEAFAHGVPVVASRLGSLAELIEDGKTGLLAEAGNAAQLSLKIRQSFESPNELRLMGNNARKVFEEKYSAQVNYQKLISIYLQAIDRFQNKSL